MDVLISGASGTIGSALRDALEQRGHHTVALTRSPGERRGDTVGWDPTRGSIDAAGLAGIDAVVHLAGEPLLGRWTEDKKRRMYDSRIDGTRLLARTVAELDDPPSVFLSGSAVGYYGSRGDEVLTEESGPGHGFLASLVVDWERAAQPAVDAGIRTCHLRTGLVMDRDNPLLRLQLPAFHLGLGARLGTGRQWFPWVAIADHVGATIHLLDDEGASGPFNLTGPDPVREEEFARTLARVLHRPMFLTVPEFAVSAVFGSDATREMAAASQRVIPERLIEERGYEFRHHTLESALREALDRPAA